MRKTGMQINFLEGNHLHFMHKGQAAEKTIF